MNQAHSFQMDILPSHVAILVPSARKAAEHLKKYNFQIGEEKKFAGEGTVEIYVEREKTNSLLLMEPLKTGPYQRAMEKRGPGLHHLAIDVLDLENYIETLVGSGWLLHPKSIKMMKHAKTAYLARPGFPGLIEVQQKPKSKRELDAGSLFVQKVTLPVPANLVHLLSSIGLKEIVQTGSDVEFLCAGHVIKMTDLV